MESTHVAAIEALFASVNPTTSEAKQLNSTLTSAINLVASMSYHPASVRRAYYGSLLHVFDRIRLRNKGQDIDFDLTSLKTTLFGSDVEIEALRLLRADAILSIGKTSPNLTLKMKDDISALLADEKSSNVRDRLAQLR
jgi:proteasome component ECM29